jgi:hypothetical protein
MTVLDRVNEARRTLRRALVVAAVLEALAGALGVVLAFGVVDALFGIPPIGRMLASPLALLAAVALGFRRLTQSGVRKDVESVALWIESRFPALNYALVTAVDPLYAGRVPEIERQASRVEFEPGVSRAARSAVALPGAIAAVCAALLLVLPTGARSDYASRRQRSVGRRCTRESIERARDDRGNDRTTDVRVTRDAVPR